MKNLWSLVTAGRQSVWDFVDFLETCSSSGQLQLVCHKPDKKKEKAIAFSMKQVWVLRVVQKRAESNTRLYGVYALLEVCL